MEAFTRRSCLSLMFATGSLVSGGCAIWNSSWDGPTESKNPLKPPRLAPDVAVIEYRFCEVPPVSVASTPGDWSGIDELSIDSEVRRRLSDNGIRCGVCGPVLPEWLESLARRPTKSLNDLATDVSDSFIFEKNHTLQCRKGEPTRIVMTSSPRPQMAVLLSDGVSLSGATYQEAQGIIELKAFPQGDRTTRLELTPVIEHGDAKQRIFGQEGIFVMNSSRERRRIEQLQLNVTLLPGQTFVVGCSEEPKGLGATLFTDKADGLLRQRLLLLRFAKSEADDLFNSDRDRAPVVNQ